MPKQGVTLSSGRLLRYSKPPLNIPGQLQQLRDRGLLVRSDDFALNALELIGYYRLSAYWLFFEEAPALGETRSHRFKPGYSFEQVIELYNRDRLIRLLVIDAIERIEIAARSAWVQEMSMKHGPHCYLDPLLFRSDFNHGEQLEQLRSQLQQSNETFVIHYRQTYSEPELPPTWAMTELISLGMPSAQVLNGVQQANPRGGRRPAHAQGLYMPLQSAQQTVPPMADSSSRFGFVAFAETWNGRLAMLGFVIGLATELLTGQGILSQIGLG